MEWTQFIIFFLGVFGLFIWNRTESRSDIRHMDMKIDAIRDLVYTVHKETQASLSAMSKETQANLDAIRKETQANLDAIRKESQANLDGIREEMKDFHEKLYEIKKSTSP